jgi:biopolymer transport protein ExbD
MTPLVDLGFLLITFFMLTTHLIDQRVMNLELPLPGKATTANNTLTILLDEKGRRYGYQGEFSAATLLQPLGGKTLRNTLHSFQAISAQVEQEPVCIVKANDGVRYQQVVTAIDEIQHADIKHFSIADSISSGERELLLAMAR